MRKKLYRATYNRMLGGVCSGIAEYFEVDPTLIRLIVAFLIIITGFIPGAVFYIVAWAIIPRG
ncbi:phage shock protein PspC (stress-responsive transcriptional regulator) [Desulfitispora alkaliphila]|uniref:PspC domain-containing protein n=1 Tax=Desulfitispora alkaliphila TaxID=622674 RepID=UPI003D24F8A0